MIFKNILNQIFLFIISILVVSCSSGIITKEIIGADYKICNSYKTSKHHVTAAHCDSDFDKVYEKEDIGIIDGDTPSFERITKNEKVFLYVIRLGKQEIIECQVIDEDPYFNFFLHTNTFIVTCNDLIVVGDSGSPLLNKKNDLVGILWGVNVIETFNGKIDVFFSALIH